MPLNTQVITNNLKQSPFYKGAYAIISELHTYNYKAFFAGGAVRDAVLNRPIKDIDIATTAPPNIVQNIFPRNKAVGAHFGVILVNQGKNVYEVATFRRDGEYKDGRRPENVVFTDDKEDALRRDFTINGLFYNPLNETIIDYVGGLHDLEKKLITAINNPYKRFEEDKLRILRLIRFYTQLAPYGFSIEENTLLAATAMAKDITKISNERIKEEIYKILLSSNNLLPLEYLEKTTLSNFIFPVTPNTQNKTFFLELKKDPAQPCEMLLFSLFWDFSNIIPILSKNFVFSHKEKELLQNTSLFMQKLPTINSLPLHSIKRLLRTSQVNIILTFIKTWQSLFFPHYLQFTQTLLSYYEKYKNTLYPPSYLTGETLLSSGLKPSPLFKTLLTEIENAQLDETITSEKECYAYLETLLKKLTE